MLLTLALAAAPIGAPTQSSAPATAAARDVPTWPQWRGPHRDGSAPGGPWPDGLDEERVERRWRVTGLGPSYAGPIVSADRVFTVATEDRAEEVVRAYDRATGEELWTASWEGAMKVPFFAASRGSWVRSTPAFDGDTLYVGGMRDVLVALDAESGEVRWSADLMARYDTPLPDFGFVCSPLVADGRVYVQTAASLLALDAETGETVWRSLVDAGGMNGSAFGSPALATIAGRQQLLVQTRTRLAGVDPEQGAVLWSTDVPAFRGMNILTPLEWRGSVFTSSYGGSSLLMGLEDTDSGLEPVRTWSNRRQGYMTSPVLIGDHVYLFMRSNRFACLDLATGEDAWISGPTGDEYWSLACQGERILALSDTGVLRLIAASPEAYEPLGEVQLVEGESWAHLAVAGDELFVRELDALTAFTWR